jgi:hypothetical protein
VLEHPSLEDFEEELRKGYDFVGINFTLVNIVKTMQWLDPHPLEEEWEAALARGETEARDSAKLQEVLDRHELQLPLPSPDIEPKFRPGAIRVYK